MSTKETIMNLGRTWNKTCILKSTWYGNPMTGGKREENKFHRISSKWTYNLSIFNFIRLHSYWNDELDIWSMSSAIKSHSLQESGPCLSLSNYLPPLTDILWRTCPGINTFYVGLVRDTYILVEAPPWYRRTFSLLTFTWIVLFYFFLSFVQ